ncbi:MAG: rod shape-determining protein MreD [Methylotetracoccus sp.]
MLPPNDDKEPPGWLIAVSLLVALILRILPLPREIAMTLPDWALLLLVYWVLAAPDRVALGWAWLTGLLADLMTGRALGQHALAYVLVAYLCLRLQRRLPHYPLVQQCLCIALLLLLGQFVVFWTQETRPEQWLAGYPWLAPAALGALLWPAVLHLMHALWRRDQAG